MFSCTDESIIRYNMFDSCRLTLMTLLVFHCPNKIELKIEYHNLCSDELKLLSLVAR